MGASLFTHERRPGTLSLLFSLPVARGRILAAKLAAGLVSLLLAAAGGHAAWLAFGSSPGPGMERGAPWWMALLLATLLSAALAIRVSLEWQEPVMALLLGGALGSLVFSLLTWIEEPSDVRGGAGLLAAVIATAVWSLWPRFATLEDRAPRWAGRLLDRLPASRMQAPSLLAIEWRQKRILLGILALLPLVQLMGVGWIEPVSVILWAYPAGAFVGVSLFTARERDGSRFLLQVLPIGRGRLAAERLLGGLAFGGLFLAECLLVFWAATVLFEKPGYRALGPDELQLVSLIVVFLYGTSFLIGAALSPWLRSTLVAAILALVTTFLVFLACTRFAHRLESVSEAWSATGVLLAALAGVAGWSTVCSRAFEPLPRKDLRVLLTFFVLWLAIVGIVFGLDLIQ